MLRTLLIAILCQATLALKITDDTCSNMAISGPIIVKDDNTVIENTIIWADPTTASDTSNDYAIKIASNVENVTIRNVLIYHAANGMGIYAFRPKNLRIENVQVHAYGNDWGAQPCPTRKPFAGYDCSNIKIYHADGLVMDTIHVENGSRGVSLKNCTGAEVSNLVAKNVRGP